MATLIIFIFLTGYLAITTEHTLGINKAASSLLTGVLCWTIYILSQDDYHLIVHQLEEHIGEISGILFFLMGAMTIVEVIDAHDGFEIITTRIKTKDQRILIWMISFITFFLSAVLDNLTTTIVMVSVLRKILPEGNTRLLFISMVVLAANAGGAWSPIGDVTTTMLWIGGQITSTATIIHLILPSLVCAIFPLLIISLRMNKQFEGMMPIKESTMVTTDLERKIVFALGVLSLVFVPIFKSITHLPPYMGILGALGFMWVITEIIHSKKDGVVKDKYSVLQALRKIDMPSILFFLGILLAIGVLQNTGTLSALADWLTGRIGNIHIVVMCIGVLSAIVDNVPLVAAVMNMYDLSQFPVDHSFWQLLAFAAGTGGSMLIIGSAAGVAAMGIEKIKFFWYLKNMGWLAFVGFLAGTGVYLLQMMILD